MPRQCVCIGLCALGATLASASARSAGASELPAVTVSYRNLDLRQSADVHRLYARLQQAVARVCPAAPPYELARYALYQRCMHAALTAAVQAVEKQQPGVPLPAASKQVSGITALVTPCARPARL